MVVGSLESRKRDVAETPSRNGMSLRLHWLSLDGTFHTHRLTAIYLTSSQARSSREGPLLRGEEMLVRTLLNDSELAVPSPRLLRSSSKAFPRFSGQASCC